MSSYSLSFREFCASAFNRIRVRRRTRPVNYNKLWPFRNGPMAFGFNFRFPEKVVRCIQPVFWAKLSLLWGLAFPSRRRSAIVDVAEEKLCLHQSGLAT